MFQQLADFDIMKKTLMRDLQNRREKCESNLTAELEMALDDTREQCSTVLRNSNNKAQQKMGVPGAQLGAADFGSEAADRAELGFETQLQALREHLEQARSQKSASNTMNLNFGRIAMPLRGGALSPSITVKDDRYSRAGFLVGQALAPSRSAALHPGVPVVARTP
ncbi:hypothetical protein BG005_001092 [Podila minutissima]|nr:hypothetical protein BG005_001092 [Podila minutissima]